MPYRVGNYLVFKNLGDGPFGSVNLGAHQETGAQVCIKVLDNEKQGPRKLAKDTRREIARLRTIRHRNLVSLHRVLVGRHSLYAVTDLTTGGDLCSTLLDDAAVAPPPEPPSPTTTAAYAAAPCETTARKHFQQLVDVVEYCHRRAVFHRALSAHAVRLDAATGNLRVADFGLAAMKGADTSATELFTLQRERHAAYMAPEMISAHEAREGAHGDDEADGATQDGLDAAKLDSWACGILLYALLAGRLPFAASDECDLLRAIQHDAVSFPPHFPPAAQDLVRKLLHKRPEQRFSLVQVKRHKWFLAGYDGDDIEPTSDSE